MADNKSVYIVTSGDYSDYHIDAVFSTKAAADRFVAEAKRERRSHDIEEYELDERENDKRVKAFFVTLHTDTGALYGKTEQTVWKSAVSNSCSSGPNYCARGSVKSYDHALKLAAEARQAWLMEHGKEVKRG